MNETYKFPEDSTLTHTEIEQQIRNINSIMELYDSLLKFIWEFENIDIHIFNCQQIIMNFKDDFEGKLQDIKSEFEIV